MISKSMLVEGVVGLASAAAVAIWFLLELVTSAE